MEEANRTTDNASIGKIPEPQGGPSKMKIENILTRANGAPENCHICESTAVISCDDYDTPIIKCTKPECGIFIGAKTQNEAISIWNTLQFAKLDKHVI